MCITKSESPVVVVLRQSLKKFSRDDCLANLQMFSGSMEPAFQRGDILFLTNRDDPIRAGEIVVFKIKDRDIPIVHRVMKVHEKEDGKVGHSCT